MVLCPKVTRSEVSNSMSRNSKPTPPQAALLPLFSKITFTALAAVVLISAAAASAQPVYTVTDLGAVAGSGGSTAAYVNDRGYVAGASISAPNFPQTGLVWRNSGLFSTGLLPKGNYSYATAVNSQGVAVGDGDTGNFRPQSWVTTPGGLLNFFPNNGGNTHAIGINDAGAICGYYTKSLSGNTGSWRGAVWTPDPKDSRKYREQDLPIMVGIDPTTSTAIPFGFNQSGQAAGYAVNDVIGQHACMWNGDAARTIVDLGVFPGDWSSTAAGLNDLGQVVGTSHPPAGNRPVLWNNDVAHTPVELPFLPGDNAGDAMAINSLGQVLGTSYYLTPGTWDGTPARYVIWRDGGVFELQTLLDGATGQGWAITTVGSINNLGQIAGYGVHNGVTHAFLLSPAG